MEFDQFERAYLRLGDDFPVEDKKFLHRLTAAQQRLKRCPTTDHNINRGIEILNKRLQAVRHAKDKFLRDTDSIDIFSTQEGRADLMSQINVPGLGSAGATDGKSVPFSSRQGADSSSLSLLIEPLTVWRKLHYEYHLCEKRFAVIVSESSNAPPSLGPLAYRLANELLLLISEQFNRLYDFPYVYAKIQLALFILCGFLICLPYSFPFHMLRYLSCFLFTLYLSFIYTEISQNLWTVCREVNAVTGRFGIYFDSANVRLAVGLRLTFYNVQTFITLRDLVIAAGGLRFLRAFEQWDVTFPAIPINTASASTLALFNRY